MKNETAPNGIITLMTDFGNTDSYVGIMKGVIIDIAPLARIVDITHNVSSYHIASAGYLLSTYYDRFPPGTVHCIVVDPGVGGERAAVAARFEDRFFVLPDNGLISMTAASGDGEIEARRIENPDMMLGKVSATFHGRDIFAPAAARLAAGAPFDSVGPLLDPLDTSVYTKPVRSGNTVAGEIVHIDKFGNYITSIPESMLSGMSASAIFVRIGGFNIIGLSRTYSDGNEGDLAAYIGSSGLLEVCAVNASAVEAIGIAVGSEVMVKGRDS